MAVSGSDFSGGNNAAAPAAATVRSNRKAATRRDRARSNAAPSGDEGPSPDMDRALSIVTTSSDEPPQYEGPRSTSSTAQRAILAGEETVQSLLAEPTTIRLLSHCKPSVAPPACNDKPH